MGKYELQMQQIGRCMDKLHYLNFEPEEGTENKIWTNFQQYFDNKVKNCISIFLLNTHAKANGYYFYYSTPNWQEQLLAKVDELLGDSK